MTNKTKKKFLKRIPNEIWAIVIAGAIGLYFGYVNASIHIWGAVLGMWILMVLYQLMDLKRKLEK